MEQISLTMNMISAPEENRNASLFHFQHIFNKLHKTLVIFRETEIQTRTHRTLSYLTVLKMLGEKN